MQSVFPAIEESDIANSYPLHGMKTLLIYLHHPVAIDIHIIPFLPHHSFGKFQHFLLHFLVLAQTSTKFLMLLIFNFADDFGSLLG